MKKLLTILFVFCILLVHSQCNVYQVFEGFGSTTLTTQGGTWASNSMISSTNAFRTGARSIGFNGAGDWIRTPQISTPGILSFWYKRSSNTTAWSLVVETSTDNTTWTTRNTITNATTTFQQYTLNLGALNLTNVYVRLRDARSTGAHERYVEDLSWTSTNSNDNILVPFPITGNCVQTINSSYTIIDQGGPNETYNNSMDQTMTLQPSDNTKKIELTFSSFSLETNYDTLFIYDGPNTTFTKIGSYTGNVNPGTIISTSSGGELTLRVKTDVSNVGTWTGFQAMASMITPLPVELIQFDSDEYPQWNVIKWTTASEYNSDYFDLEKSIDGEYWVSLTKKKAAGNSTEILKYSYIDINQNEITYYRLLQYDVDGKFKTYGPISSLKQIKNKVVVNYINLMGQTVHQQTKGVIFEVYDDGTTRKIINY